jgi:hypothetical protein
MTKIKILLLLLYAISQNKLLEEMTAGRVSDIGRVKISTYNFGSKINEEIGILEPNGRQDISFFSAKVSICVVGFSQSHLLRPIFTLGRNIFS